MHSFLEQAVSQLLDRHGDQLDRIALVLPGQRPMVFLRDLLAQRLTRTTWSPAMFTIQEATERLSGFRRMDAMELWLTSYRIYRDTVKNPESLDAFLTWAPTVLADFNEIDNYGLHGEDVFRNLASFTEIDAWSFHLDPLSEGQERFQVQWEAMGQFYQALRTHLHGLKVGYNGLVNREAATHYEARLDTPHWPYDHTYFLGFNALSASEEAVLFGLEKMGRATLLWDADPTFVDPEVNEAGLFLRRFAERHGALELPKRWALESEGIHLHTTASRAAQPKVLASLLASIPAEELSKTAVVLGDESLLIPVLESLPPLGDPESPLPYNLTLGYALRWTPVYDLIHLLHSTQIRMRGQGVWHQDLRSLLRHPALVTALSDHAEAINTLLGNMRDNNLAYLPVTELEAHMNAPVIEAMCRLLTQRYSSPQTTCALLLGILDALRVPLEHNPWLLEMVFRTHRSLTALQTWCAGLAPDTPLGEAAFWNLWRRLAGQEQLDFRGEPLNGLQVMGMLETRTLGFERLLVIGANEGHMPRTPVQNSFIPYDLKRHFRLPVRHERDAIYAYYFFRLLTDAKHVDFIYAEQSEAFGSTERTRYLGQLEALLDTTFTPQHWQNALPAGEQHVWNVPGHDPAIARAVTQLLQNGLSPSAMNTFVRCPLDFYFKYILGFREPDEVNEGVDQALFGTLVHGTLEHLYLGGEPADPKRDAPLNIRLTPAFIDTCLEALPQVFAQMRTRRLAVPEDPNKPVRLPDMQTGINRLTLETAEAYVKQFLQAEKRNAREHVPEILFLEKQFQVPVPLPEGSAVGELVLRGTVDRIDRVNGQVRIIDYKTGSVDNVKLRWRGPEALAKQDRDKARQLLVYHLLVEGQTWLNGMPVISGMISIKQISKWFQAGQKEGPGEPFTEEQIEEFKTVLATLTGTMLDPEFTWQHAPDSDFCAFCTP